MFKNKQNKRRKKAENIDFMDIYGIHAVKAALKNKHRKHKILTISQSNSHLISEKIAKKIEKINLLENKEVRKLHGSDNIHQGIILKTSILEQPTVEKILEKTKTKEVEVIVMLDQVTDPNNIGSIIRSCLLFKCHNVIVAKDNSPAITSSMAKAASGAIEHVNYVSVTNISRTINTFKKNNFWVCGLENNKNKTEKNFEIPKKCLLILGAEGKGLRNLTSKECDYKFSIPINTNLNYDLDSLNVSNACSIALYEHFKKHR
tara:strand:+ start:63 stop:845 length:783 start_codon:yes stop_codon:yes gene_type:complete